MNIEVSETGSMWQGIEKKSAIVAPEPRDVDSQLHGADSQLHGADWRHHDVGAKLHGADWGVFGHMCIERRPAEPRFDPSRRLRGVAGKGCALLSPFSISGMADKR